MLVRYCKALLVLALSVLPALSAYGQWTDSSPIQTALSEILTWVTGPVGEGATGLQANAEQIVFWSAQAVLATKAFIFALFVLAGFRLLRRRSATVEEFQSAKSLVFLASTLVVLAGAITLFVMGPAALTGNPDRPWAYAAILLVTLLVLQPDTELEANKKPRRRTIGN